jgi:ABC-type multidrug transport system fused ATPase/permease subunit
MNKDQRLIGEAYQNIYNKEYIEEFLGTEHITDLYNLFTNAFPAFCQHLAQWFQIEWPSLLVGAGAVPAIGYILKFLNRSYNDKVEKYQKEFEDMLDERSQEKLSSLEELKKTDPAKAAKQEIRMRVKARDLLYTQLTTGPDSVVLKNTQAAAIIGSICTTLVGSLGGVIFTAILLQYSHINPFPIFEMIGH